LIKATVTVYTVMQILAASCDSKVKTVKSLRMTQ